MNPPSYDLVFGLQHENDEFTEGDFDESKPDEDDDKFTEGDPDEGPSSSIGIDYDDEQVMYIGMDDDSSLSSSSGDDCSLADKLRNHRHYYVHLCDGAEVINPESIQSDQLLAGLKRAWIDRSYDPISFKTRVPRVLLLYPVMETL
ncbi:OLC1v1013428C1 [Oldenlandia corymbosa var. corymbosa]|uniref:OLC1v1013428C1 n=1 Tax=Oldenlandia corymbosa var. corymbosa TaxID=529605 RepID=A0AAV1E1Q5_OLDCO|nr:OLC1v1013428C1 [Oldenlandia corymbosa var. corymbosa]